MEGTLAGPRAEVNQYAPKILTTKVDEDKIGAVIGTGGKTIKGIAQATGAEVNIDDDGTVTIYGKNTASAMAALEMVKAIIEEPEVGIMVPDVEHTEFCKSEHQIATVG